MKLPIDLLFCLLIEFPKNINSFSFLFVSSFFVKNIEAKVKNLNLRTKINGAVINSVNLLLLAENIKSGEISYKDCCLLFESNGEIKI
ncbi:MAG: hypothetical protein Ta2G_21000 [Termitinemataceae bacterium]|nr:MAG: hypothetical protein Ta2G_21000 [Termitinemataceae bacterium]